MRWLAALGLLGLVSAAVAWPTLQPGSEGTGGTPSARSFSLDRRPHLDRYLFDEAGTLEHFREGTNRFLRRMSERYRIEAVIVTLRELPAGTYLEEIAVGIVDRWRIGAKHEGRGLLLLLVEREKQVKLEVTYELEDVFTDAFTRYVEDIQLRPYYLAHDLGTGLVAAMEELERRAEMKGQGDYAPKDVARLDERLLSGGAGAVLDLGRDEPDREAVDTATHRPSRGARSAREAWEVMLTKWAGEGADIDVDVYTEMTKLAMGDPDHVDPRTRRSVGHWRNASYRVRQNGDHAVIWFGKKDGWDNAPFLFCRTPTGWKFDIVHQRRLVVMGPSPTWMIEQGNYPYVDLLKDAPVSRGKDLPLPIEDRYSCRNDAELARQIQRLEQARLGSPDDPGTLMSLARLNVITGRRPAHVRPLLDRLRKLAPSDPDVYKYAAIYHVNSFFQYQTALRDMQTYRRLRPGDPFGHRFIGFLHYRLGEYKMSIQASSQALELAPEDAYARDLRARANALLPQ